MSPTPEGVEGPDQTESGALLDESLHALVHRSPEGILVHADGIVRFVNASAVALLGGRDPSEVLGRPISEFLPPPFLRAVQERLVQGDSRHPAVSEELLTRMDGSTTWVDVAALGYLHEDGPAVQVFLRDVTDRRLAREAMRAREVQLRLLLERIPALFWTTDANLGMQFWHGGNAEAGSVTVEEFFGTPPDEVPGTTHRTALAGSPASDILDWRGGQFEVRVEPLHDEAGRIVGTAGVALETTHRRLAETRERDERELVALGRVAGGVAHGVNNALAAITGVASALSRDVTLGPEVRRGLETILQASGGARTLTANLLGFAQQGRYRLVRVNLNSIVGEIAAPARARGRDITLDLEPGLPVVEGDRDQLKLAIANLCDNAVDATHRGGQVWITTTTIDVAGPIEGPSSLAPGRYVRLTVRDSGEGMSEETRTHAIEPFFTTKELGKGTGLGLSMAYGVARHHGGDLRIESLTGRGTTVSLWCPVQTAPLSEASLAVAPERAPGRQLVMVVDDDEWVRYSSSAILKRLDFDVLEAQDGPTALDLFQRPGQRNFAVILLDLRMPGMDGEQVLNRLLAIDPGARVIICTGYDRDQVSQGLFKLGRVGFLGKPFTVEQVEAEIARVCADDFASGA